MDVNNFFDNDNDFQVFYPYREGACRVPNRDEVIDRYLDNRLNKEEAQAFETHIFYCEECFKQLRLRREIDEVMEDAPRKRWALSIAAIIVFLILFGWGGRYAFEKSLPPFYSQARLTEEQGNLLLSTIRNGRDLFDPDTSETEFAKGAAFLVTVEDHNLIFFPYFDSVKADSAIFHFEKAYRLTDDDFQRNKCAYFIGKTYLMKNDPTNARKWLNKIFETDAVVYRDKAQQILDKLAASER